MQDAAVRGSVKLVQVKGPNTDWQSMNNVWGASWESTSVPMPPLDFRIQDDTGTEVTSVMSFTSPIVIVILTLTCLGRLKMSCRLCALQALLQSIALNAVDERVWPGIWLKVMSSRALVAVLIRSFI